MKTLLSMPRRAAALAAAMTLLGAATTASAQTQPPKDALRAAVSNAVLQAIGDSPRETVMRVMQVKPDGAISKNFNLQKIVPATFGRAGAVSAPDCRTTVTQAGEPDPGLCILDQGKRDEPASAYTLLAFSKNLGAGNVRFIRRAAFLPGDTREPTAVKLSDDDAYKQALNFAELLGIPKSEIPIAPAGAKNPLPVRTLAVAGERDRGSAPRIPIQKVVQIPRAFSLPLGLMRTPLAGQPLTHVIAPGSATFVVDDRGVQMARIDGWSDAQLDPKLNPALSKTFNNLVNEIVDDMWNEGVRKAGRVSVHVALRRAYPNPDDPNPPLCPVCGVLRPALKVLISQVGPDFVVTGEKNFVAPGLVREYDLVEPTEAERIR
jgi:hypothetical protein